MDDELTEGEQRDVYESAYLIVSRLIGGVINHQYSPRGLRN